jgi:outer membrane protein assembly factor BamB
MANSDVVSSSPSLRLWPGVVTVALLWIVWLLVPRLVPDGGGLAIMGAFGAGVLVALWWLFFSRAPWLDRIGALVLMVAGVFATAQIAHPSIVNGFMGRMLPIFSIPGLCLALVTSAWIGKRLAAPQRRAVMAAAIVAACGALTLIRTDGITGDANSLIRWRWTPTAEERLLAASKDEPAPLPPAATTAPVGAAPSPTATGTTSPATPAAANPAAASATIPAPPAVDAIDSSVRDWPGFRGADRNGIVPGVRIETDWAASPPKELWRRKIGPGWSSFATSGGLLFTQEQRGEDEVVASYSLVTGQPVWRHRDKARFWESNAGPGPRGTPAVAHGRVYALGATGLLNALDARTGAVVWSRDARADTSANLPGWGFAASPLVVDDLVIVALSGRLAAYHAARGTPKWRGAATGGSYSSPHLVTIDGVRQIVLLTSTGATAASLEDGSTLWQHEWAGTPMLQPALAAERDLLIATGDMMGGVGVRRIALTRGSSGWSAEERWTSRGLKPYFNDFVVHEGHAYGFDGRILSCIDLADGERKWKGGRYGNGQLVLLPDQDLLLVLSEEGELALVKATADQFTEIAKVAAIEGKTWNHPIIAGDVLVVRNGEEMAAFRLTMAK